MTGTFGGRLVLRLMDAGVLVASLFLALRLRGLPLSTDYIMLALIAIVLLWLIAEGYQIYTVPTHSLSVLGRHLLQAWLWTVVFLLFLGWMCKCTHRFSRLAMGLWAVGAPLGLVVVRGAWLYGLTPLYTRQNGQRKAVFIGWNPLAQRLLEHFQQNPQWGIRPVAVLVDEETTSPPPTLAPMRGRKPEDLRAFFQNHGVDVVFLAGSAAQQELKTLGKWLNGPCDVYILPETPLFPFLNPRPEEFGGVPCWALFASPLQGPAQWLKRLEDLVIGTLALVVFAPLMLLIAIAIRLDSPGPVLFRQRRYGLNGKTFWMWKFRTMRVVEDGPAVKPATQQDKRVTRVGRWLRRFSLDELPQLFNVLKGEMSLVGPRPFAVVMDDQFRKYVDGFILRYRVKPGMTGWAQVHGWRGEIKTKEDLLMRLQYDLYYIHNWSLFLDLKILWMTIWRGFYHPKAY